MREGRYGKKATRRVYDQFGKNDLTWGLFSLLEQTCPEKPLTKQA